MICFDTVLQPGLSFYPTWDLKVKSFDQSQLVITPFILALLTNTGASGESSEWRRERLYRGGSQDDDVVFVSWDFAVWCGQRVQCAVNGELGVVELGQVAEPGALSSIVQSKLWTFVQRLNFDKWKDSPGDLTFETLSTILTIENLNSDNHYN